MKCSQKVVLAGFLGSVASVGSVVASANTVTAIVVNNRTATQAVFGSGALSEACTLPLPKLTPGT